MSERPKIAPEAEAGLAKSRRVFLISLRSDGSPTAHPMTGVFADGRLAFSTYRSSAKTRNVERDPRTCSLALEGYGGPGRHAVVYRGRARVLQGEAALRALGTGDGGAAGPVSTGVAARATDRLREGKRVVLAIDPVEVERLGAPGV